METGLKQISKLTILFACFLLLNSGCGPNPIVDTNVNMPENNWTYTNKLTAGVAVTDSLQPINVYLKLRVTSDYRYSNIYILFTLKSPDGRTKVRRYRYKIAANDGQWLGKGSGNLYTYKLPLLTRYNWPVKGNYQLMIEQNMRDNPLTGISDGGILIEKLPEQSN